MSRRPRRGALAAVAMLVALLCLPTIAAAAEEPGTWTFNYNNGEPQTFVVPKEVTKLSMLAIGGAGAPASDFYLGAPGGSSGATYGRFEVTPGEVLTVWVGGEGLAKTGNEGISKGYGCGGQAGYGRGPLFGHATADGGGGGAASAVARGEFEKEAECPGQEPAPEAHLLVVAGGGGGGGEGSYAPQQGGKGRAGGSGGNPPGGIKGTSGCGGCRPGPAGEGGADAIQLEGGGGGGGGGYRGGGGGGTGPFGAEGGGGGSSYVGPGALESAYLPGHGTGNGNVVITALETESFACTGHTATTRIGAGVTLMEVEATGGAGDGGAESQPEVLGGKAGTGAGTFKVSPGETYEVSVGCPGGKRDGGWGYGIGGRGGGKSLSAEDGHGGGGSSAVVRPGSGALVVAGGGGGSGGRGGPEYKETESGVEGGAGGAGGDPAAKGAGGAKGSGTGDGGEGGSVASQTGGTGETAHDLTEGGGGGGGGAGWQSGAGGERGPYLAITGGGGGGGGGGLSHVAEGATNVSVGTGELVGGGLVNLSFLHTGPELISAFGGSGQSIEIGGEFAEPLAARVADVAANPVPGASVTFTLPSSGASGTFAGGGTTAVATTDEEGIATSPAVIADGIGGAWEATAAVAPVASPATFGLVNTGSPTTVAVTPSDDPTTPTEPVTFTATVHALNTLPGTPTGTVQFYEGETTIGVPVELSGGSATSVPLRGLATGTHEIEARYGGATSFQPGARSASVLVERTATATTITSSRNPVTAGESVRFTATVSVPGSSSPYEGEVEFGIGETGFDVPTTNGVAVSPPYEVTSGGDLLVSASASGTADFEGSEGLMVQSTNADGSGVEIVADVNPVEYGTPFELETTVVPAPPLTVTPQGSVVFHGGGVYWQSTLVGGRTSSSPPAAFAPGSQGIEGRYEGDSSYKPSSGLIVEQVLKAKTSTSVTGTPGTVRYGEGVTLDAEVGRRTAGQGMPSGTVAFAIDGTSVGAPQSLTNGRAESGQTTPQAGVPIVSARYGGDVDFKGSEGGSPYLVLPDPTQVALTASDASSQPGADVTFTATVGSPPLAGGAAAPTPTGAVQFRVDGLDFGSPVALRSGSAVSMPDGGLAPGGHRVAAIFLPSDGNFLSSAAKLAHLVEQPTSTVVASMANPSAAGAPVTLHAHVGPTGAEGRLSFAVDGSPVASCQELPVAENEASCEVPGLAVGEHEVSATFSGTPLLDPSRGAMTQTVEAEPAPSEPSSSAPGAAASPASPVSSACALRKVRARMLMFRKRPAIRLVARYLAEAPATQVTVDFFDRGGNGGWGKRLGTIERTWTEQGTARLDLRLPPRAMDRLRHGKGFGARFVVAGDPGFCAEKFDRDLSLRRKVDGQSVWFQTGSSLSDLPGR